MICVTPSFFNRDWIKLNQMQSTVARRANILTDGHKRQASYAQVNSSSALNSDSINDMENFMIKKINAIFDGQVLRPVEPLDIEPNTRVRIGVEVPDERAEASMSFLDTAQGLDLDGPVDWSENVDACLYEGRAGSDA